MSSPLKHPNFLIIGAGKSGTTSIFNYLKNHPDIFLCDGKDPGFFGYQDFSLEEKQLPPSEIDFFYHPGAITNIEDYKALFKEVKNQKAIGECSTIYLYNEHAPKNIHLYTPKVKIIAIFRNPTERLYSRYLHLLRDNRAPTKLFDDCLDKNSIWWQRRDLVSEGFYFSHMKRYYELFDPQQIKVFLYEDLISNPKQLIQDVYTFLDVDPHFIPDIQTKYNVSGKIKNQFIHKIIGPEGILKKGLIKMAPKTLKAISSNKKIEKWALNLRNKNLSKPPIDPNVKQKLTHEVYKKEVLKFQELIDRDLSKWVE